MAATLCISLPSISLLYGMDEDSNRAHVDLSVKVIGRQWYWGYEMDELMPSLGWVPATSAKGTAGANAAGLHLAERQLGADVGRILDRNRADAQLEFWRCLVKSRSALEQYYAAAAISPAEMDELREKFRWVFDAVLTPFDWGRNKFNAVKLRLLDSQFLVLPLKRNIQLLITSDDVIHSFAMPSAGIKTDALPGRINSVVCSFFRNALMFGQCSELCGAGHGFMPISFLILAEGYLAYTVADLGELMLSIVERYKASYGHAALVLPGSPQGVLLPVFTA